MSDIILKQLAPKGYLRAAINMSNFLLVTGIDPNGDPEGVSPDMAKALANQLGVELKLIPFKRPGELADAILDDVWDIGNIANEAERAKSITFSSPYALIESTFLVRDSSNIQSLKDVDQKGIRIAVAERSAYDLWLTENIKNAELIRAKSIDESFSRSYFKIPADPTSPVCLFFNTTMLRLPEVGSSASTLRPIHVSASCAIACDPRS